MPSAISKLKVLPSSNIVKRALNLITSDITTAHSAGSISRGRQLVDDMCKKMPSSSDPLFTLLMMCKEAKAQNHNTFV